MELGRSTSAAETLRFENCAHLKKLLHRENGKLSPPPQSQYAFGNRGNDLQHPEATDSVEKYFLHHVYHTPCTYVLISCKFDSA